MRSLRIRPFVASRIQAHREVVNEVVHDLTLSISMGQYVFQNPLRKQNDLLLFNHPCQKLKS